MQSSYEDSLKTAKLPILTNSPGHEHNMTLDFLSILSSVCSSSLLQAQLHTALSSQVLAIQGCRTKLLPQFTFWTTEIKKKSLHANTWEKKKLIKTFLPLCSPLLLLFVTGKQVQWDMSYAALHIEDREILTINIKTEYLVECKCLGTKKVTFSWETAALPSSLFSSISSSLHSQSPSSVLWRWPLEPGTRLTYQNIKCSPLHRHF